MSLINPKSLIAVGSILPTLAAVAVALRFRVRRARTALIGIDDWLILFALVLCVGLGIMEIVGSAIHALGQPLPSGSSPKGFAVVLTPELVKVEKMKFVMNLSHIWAFGAIKLSVIFFYRRIFRGKLFEIFSKVMIGVVVTWTLSFFFSYLFECGTNFGANWSTLEVLLTECNQQHVYQEAMAVSDVLTDALILIMPIPLIWQLKLSTGRKIAVCGVFFLGAGAIATSIARLAIFERRIIGSYADSQGIIIISTWQFFTMIEMGVSIIAACMPTLRPLFGELSPEQLSQLRSIFSLHSFSSLVRRNGQPSQYSKDLENGSSSTVVKMVHPIPDGEVDTKAYGMTDFGAQHDTPPGKIMVQNQISQCSSGH